jgi:hypothetical protein
VRAVESRDELTTDNGINRRTVRATFGGDARTAEKRKVESMHVRRMHAKRFRSDGKGSGLHFVKQFVLHHTHFH